MGVGQGTLRTLALLWLPQDGLGGREKAPVHSGTRRRQGREVILQPGLQDKGGSGVPLSTANRTPTQVSRAPSCPRARAPCPSCLRLMKVLLHKAASTGPSPGNGRTEGVEEETRLEERMRRWTDVLPPVPWRDPHRHSPRERPLRPDTQGSVPRLTSQPGRMPPLAAPAWHRATGEKGLQVAWPLWGSELPAPTSQHPGGVEPVTQQEPPPLLIHWALWGTKEPKPGPSTGARFFPPSPPGDIPNWR
nr:uncharacterized protein LOC109729512 [Microcebus murinus]